MSDISQELKTNTFSYFWETVGRTIFFMLGIAISFIGGLLFCLIFGGLK